MTNKDKEQHNEYLIKYKSSLRDGNLYTINSVVVSAYTGKEAVESLDYLNNSVHVLLILDVKKI